MAELAIKDFERGMTDNYIGGTPNSGRKFDNLFITRNRKPKSRFGSTVYLSANGLIPAGNQRIGSLINFNDQLFSISGDELFYDQSGSYVELVGPVDSYDAFGDIGTPALAKTSRTFWQNHLFMAQYQNDSTEKRSRPRKVYRDIDGNYQVRTAGLPSPKIVLSFSDTITFYNDLKTSLNAHISDTTVTGHIAVSPLVTAADATDFVSLVVLVNDIIDKYTIHEADARLGTPIYHPGTSSANNASAITSKISDYQTIVDLASGLNADVGSSFQTDYNLHDGDTSNGVHAFGGNHVFSAAKPDDRLTFSGSTGGSNNYIYAVVYRYEYFVDNTLYIDRSNVLEAQKLGIAEPSAGAVTVDLPTLTNDSFLSSESWETDKIKIEIYRTVTDGTVLKKVGEADNGDATFLDAVDDDDLGQNIYTTGGVEQNDSPPGSKFVVHVNDIAWYGNVDENGVVSPFRVRHSKPLDLDSCPSSFTVDVDGSIVGMGSVGIYPIVLTKGKLWRLEGTVDSLGRGFIKKRLIDDTVGCISHNSIVSVGNLLYFAGTDGFYFTDGFQARKISQHLTKSYKEAISKGSLSKINIYGAYDPESELVFWAISSRDPDISETENSEIWVHDPYWGYPNNQGSFTLMKDLDNFRPTALAVIDGELYRADSRGYVFKHNLGDTEDPVIDTSVTPDNWLTKSIVYDYVSSTFNFGSDYQRKWVTKLLTLLASNTSSNVLPKSINDDSENAKLLKPIKNSASIVWGDPFFVWGDPTFLWRTAPTQFPVRRFPKGTLRCSLKQIEYTNNRSVLANSDSDGSVNVDSISKVITLDAGTWTIGSGNDAALSGYIIFGNDPADIDSGFLITAITDTTITVQDFRNRLNDETITQWLIVNFDRDEVFQLEGYTIIYELFGESNKPFKTGSLGENVTT